MYAQNGLVTRINKNALSQTVYSIYSDSEGMLWFCTDKGVSLYNGKEFINYNVNNGMPENEVFGAFEDAQKRLWLKSLKGELFYIYHNKVFTKNNNAELKKLNALIASHSDDIFRSIFQPDRDTVYFISNNKQVYKLSKNGTSSKTALPNKYGSYQHLYINKKLYFIWKKGIYEFYSGTLVTPFELDPVYSHLQCIQFKNKTYLIKDNTIYKLNELTVEPYYKIPLTESITHFNFINDKTLLLSSPKKTYLKYQDSLCAVDALNGVNVNYIHIDVENNCWISSSNKGVFLLNNLPYHFYNNTLLAEKSITEIITAPNGLFIGDNKGKVFNLDTKTNSISNLNILKEKKVVIGKTEVRSMALQDSQYLWVGYNDEIVKYNIRTHQSKNIIKNGIKNIQTDTYGKIWVTFLDGILSDTEMESPYQSRRYFDSTSFSKRRIYGFCHDSILNCYYVSRDNLFLTYKDSIVKKEPLNARILKIETKNQKLFWIQTQANNLVVYDRSTFKRIPVYSAFNTTMTCNDFYLLNDSVAWVAGNEGYCKIEIDSRSKKIKTHHFYELMTEAGPTSITKIVYHQDILYLGTEDGLISIQEKELKTDRYDVPMKITGITINEQSAELKSNYSLKTTQSNISIDYIGLCYTTFGKTKYRYKFIGTDTSWHYTKATHLEFPDLTPDLYTLTINASDSQGNWSKHKVMVSFFIVKPWYKKALFIVSEIMLLLIITITVIRYYIRQKHKKNRAALTIKRALLEAKEKQLEAEKKMFMAQVNPHFIFNSLNSIQKFILNSKPEQAYTYIEKFSKLIRNILVNSKNELVDIGEDIENLKTYLELEQLRFKDKLEVDLMVNEGMVHEGKIPAMLIQPYVENAIWHGLMPKNEKGKLTIRYHITDDYVKVDIEDNGIGRIASLQNSQHKKGTSSGMMLTEERLKLYAQKINMSYAILVEDLYENNIATGTLITIKIPINNTI